MFSFPFSLLHIHPESHHLSVTSLQIDSDDVASFPFSCITCFNLLNDMLPLSTDSGTEHKQYLRVPSNFESRAVFNGTRGMFLAYESVSISRQIIDH